MSRHHTIAYPVTLTQCVLNLEDAIKKDKIIEQKDSLKSMDAHIF